MFDSDPFKGKTWAVTGAIPGMSRREAFEALKERGAKPTKSVSSKTDVLVSSGYTPGEHRWLSNKEIKARQNNIPIINEEQFLALLRGESLETVEELAPTPKPKETVGTTDALVGFREIVHDEPTGDTWRRICELLDKCTADDLPLVVDYLEGHLESWPITYDVRHSRYYREEALGLPVVWRREMFQGANSPKLRLVRVANFHGAQMTGQVGLKVLGCDQLNNARLIDLGRNKLSGAFFKALRGAEHMARLTHVSLRDSTLSAGACKGLVGDSTWTATALDCSRASCKKDGLRRLLSSPCWGSLTELYLDHTSSYGSDDREIAQALADAPHISALERLNLSYNRDMSDASFEALFGSEQLRGLVELRLNECELTNAQITSLAGATHLSHLRALHLSDERRTNAASQAPLIRAPHLEGLEELTMNGSGGALEALAASHVRPRDLAVARGLTEDALQALLDSDVLRDVTRLRLTWPHDDAREANNALSCRVLAHPAMRGVTSLQLNNAFFTDDHLNALLNADHLGELTHLGLSSPYGQTDFVSKKLARAVVKAPHLTEKLRDGLKRALREVLKSTG